MLVILKSIVPTGPKIALARVAGTQIIGFFTILGICSIEVPTPCATNPLHLFSRKDATAKPTIWQQHPTVAAPAAKPLKFNATPIAAELIGRVKIIPIKTDTTIPIKNGCCSTPQFTIAPMPVINPEIGGPIINPTTEPLKIVTNGVTKISTLVFPATKCPISIPI